MSGHGHGHSEDLPVSPTAKRIAIIVLVVTATITAIAMAILWPRGDTKAEDQQPPGSERVNATVVEVRSEKCPESTPSVVTACGTVTVRLDDGTQIQTSIPSGPGAPTVSAGDGVVLLHTPETPSGQPYQILDHQRHVQLWLLAGAFALAVVAFGRIRGLTALVGLAVTFVILLLFIVPAILQGRPPLLVAIVGSSAIMLSVLYLTHGFRVSTSVAVLGTLISLVLTGLLAALATSATNLSGAAGEDAFNLTVTTTINMRGILLAGILIGSLGVLDDIATTQAAAVGELARANPAYTFGELYRAAIRIGRAHIASVINTIILAYAGASLPLLLLIAAGSQPLSDILTNQLIAQEIVRSMVGTIGLIATVPITTALAVFAARRVSGGLEPPGRHRRLS